MLVLFIILIANVSLWSVTVSNTFSNQNIRFQNISLEVSDIIPIFVAD